MQKKDDKVNNKTANKKKGKGKKKESERWKIEIDRPKKLASAYAWKTKKPFDYLQLVGKYAFFVAKFISSHCYAN